MILLSNLLDFSLDISGAILHHSTKGGASKGPMMAPNLCSSSIYFAMCCGKLTADGWLHMKLLCNGGPLNCIGNSNLMHSINHISSSCPVAWVSQASVLLQVGILILGPSMLYDAARLHCSYIPNMGHSAAASDSRGHLSLR